MKRYRPTGRTMARYASFRQGMTLFVFQILVASFLLTWFILWLLTRLFPLQYIAWMAHPVWILLLILGVSAIVGGILSLFLGKFFFRPLLDLLAATKAVAAGDYSVRVSTERMLVDIPEYRSPVNEFEEFVESFNKMAEALGSVEMLRSDFVNTISHEFKTPVVSIRGYAKLLQDPELTAEERKEYTDIIIRESLRLSAMSSNILLLSRYEHTDVLTDKTVFSLDEQIRDCIQLQSGQWLDKGIDLEGELDGIQYYGNADILTHLWSNLLSNAIKFTPEGGRITVSLRRLEGAVEVRFADTGVGMDEETLGHIYEKFYQADTSRQSAGNGLGLAIAHRIVTLCGGTISVESAPGEGTTFIVTLPTEPLPLATTV